MEVKMHKKPAKTTDTLLKHIEQSGMLLREEVDWLECNKYKNIRLERDWEDEDFENDENAFHRYYQPNAIFSYKGGEKYIEIQSQSIGCWGPDECLARFVEKVKRLIEKVEYIDENDRERIDDCKNESLLLASKKMEDELWDSPREDMSKEFVDVWLHSCQRKSLEYFCEKEERKIAEELRREEKFKSVL